MRNQAQFHPLKYLAHLSNIITEKGGYIFENTTAVNIKTGEQPVVLTRGGAQITGKYILSCSLFMKVQDTTLQECMQTALI